MGKSPRAYHVAIVGSGPSGFYCADALLKDDSVKVDIYEQLPVPFGLVRYGVAPDHQSVKNVTDRFHQIGSSDRCSLFCNVAISDSPDPHGLAAHVPLSTLREEYDAVVLAYGADADRTLGVPGENLGGVHGAREFVEWYNGHPRSPAILSAGEDPFRLRSCETAVVVGHGNVALDCARMLCSTVDQLKGDTDVCAHAAASLSESGIRQVVLLGRRGVLQAAFTIKELRELSKRAGASMQLLAPSEAFAEEVMKASAAERPRKRLVELMKTLHDPAVPEPPPSPPPDGPRAIRVQFQRSPVAFVGNGECDDARVEAITLAQTALEGAPAIGQRASAIAGSEYDLPCQLALRAVGYKSSPIDGAPFDASRSVVPCGAGGRVEESAGLYATGWLKRGPNGVILTNVNDATETAGAVLADLSSRAGGGGGAAKGGGDAIRKLLSGQAQPVLDFAAWMRIDALEVERGKASGKVREKLVSAEEMIEVGVRG